MKRSRSCDRQSSVDRCGGENCARWLAVSSAFSIGGSTAWAATAAPAPTATCRATAFSFRRRAREARFQFLQWRRTWNPRAQDPLFLPIDADDFRINGAKANDFSNLRENGLMRVTLPLPPTSG